jgi:hypothetical protein
MNMPHPDRLGAELRQYRKEMERRAAKARLIRKMRAAQAKSRTTLRPHRRLLAALGRRLIQTGTHLQQRYSSVPPPGYANAYPAVAAEFNGKHGKH